MELIEEVWEVSEEVVVFIKEVKEVIEEVIYLIEEVAEKPKAAENSH